MKVAELLSELRELDVRIELDGDRLRLRAPKGTLTDDRRRQLRHHKAEIVRFLREAQQLARQQQAIVPLKPTGARVPIFGVGGHNGDVFCYQSLVRHLHPDQPFYGLQPLGLEKGGEPYTTVESLAGYLAEQLRAFRPQGPVAIAGYCAGGTIAFELARQLEAAGTPVTDLILFGAPHFSSYRILPDLTDRCINFVRGKILHVRRMLGSPAREWGRELASGAQERISGLGRASRDPVLVRKRAVEKATLAAIRRYQPRGTFDGRMDIMLPTGSWKRSLARPLRWRRHAAAASVFAGAKGRGCNNYTMLLAENAATFATFLDRAMNPGARGEACGENAPPGYQAA